MRTYVKIGVDEAGRGPWFGPVVAAALAFDPNRPPSKPLLDSLKDSKSLSESARERIFHELATLAAEPDPAVFFGVGTCDSHFVDAVGIKNANREAMRRALEEIVRKIPREFEINSVVIDGKDGYQFVETVGREAVSIVKGDTKISEISGASIIAKVFRDKLVDQYAQLYPGYGFESHKGYGTAKHAAALTGPERVTGAHRTSYAPVKAVLAKKPKLLLHVCCGPDATVPIMDLKDRYDLLCFWYDPNIQPKEEYDKRLDAFRKVCEIEGVPYVE